MKKIVICNIPMREKVDQVLYTSDDQSLPVSTRRIRYPICGFLEETMTAEDEFRVILICKRDSYGHADRNLELFKEEMAEVNAEIGASVEYTVIDSVFEETRTVHEQLMGEIIDIMPVGSHILADMTYGPKDLPIVVFEALYFAEKFLECTVDHIVYGQASFVDGHAVNTKICDMIPLYCLGSVTNTIHCSEPEKAKSMLKTLLSI